MKPIKKKIRHLKLFNESDKFLLGDDYQPLNIEIVTLQVVLSKILQEIMSLKAANIRLKDVVNYNIQKGPKDVQNFFLLLEVYGYQQEVNFFEPSISALSMQRRRSQNDLIALNKHIQTLINKLDEECVSPDRTFGYIYRDLQTVQYLISKVTDYFSAKADRLGSLSRTNASSRS